MIDDALCIDKLWQYGYQQAGAEMTNLNDQPKVYPRKVFEPEPNPKNQPEGPKMLVVGKCDPHFTTTNVQNRPHMWQNKNTKRYTCTSKAKIVSLHE